MSESGLGFVLERLYQSEIHAGISWGWQGQITVWMGLTFDQADVTRTTVTTLEAAWAWLDAEARRRYPDSDYVRGDA